MKDSLQKVDQCREATAEEIETLPHVIDAIPFLVWVALAAGAADRFTFYAIAAPWRELGLIWLSGHPRANVCGDM